MFTNFWVVLNRKNNQTTVAAGGPLPWDQVDPAGEAQKVRIEAEVTDAAKVTARNGSNDFARGAGEWKFDVSTGGQQMQRGKAHARGWVTVIDPPGGAPVQWEQDVWLN
jgi:hypothetical protein